MPLDWTSSESHILFHPSTSCALTLEEQKLFIGAFASHVWVHTSGSTSIKWTALSKQAFLASAKAVNDHLCIKRSDVWLNPLPSFHVGGLAISARCFLSGAREVIFPDATKEKWSPEKFYQTLLETKATLCSLVPTQLFDLAQRGYRAPPHLRIVLVGGAALAADLDQPVRALGWPIVPTYGCTECCSQIATGTPTSSNLMPLPHVSVSVREENLIWVKSPSLLTAYAVKKERIDIYDPKVDGWFCTHDRGAFHKGCLQVEGRAGDFVSIGGEVVSLVRLSHILESLLTVQQRGEAVLCTEDCERLGKKTVLYVSKGLKEEVQQLEARFNAAVHPYEKIRCIYQVSEIPRTPLGKVQKEQCRLVARQILC